jgi:DNA-binding response OmpR family regulator
MAEVQKRIILAVEEKQDLRIFLLLALKKTHHHVILLMRGDHALRLLEKITPHLLILNFELPDMMGLELYDRIHAAAEREPIPTIMLTLKEPLPDIGDRQITLLGKLFDHEELLLTLNTLLPG